MSLFVQVRFSTSQDIGVMLSLSKAKRLAYEKAQPQFWRYSGREAEESQAKWFAELINSDKHISLIAQDSDHQILGFVIGSLISAPAVYNPGGLTLMIDDFCVKSEDLWTTVGDQLIQSIKKYGKEKGAAQILVVCGAHDTLKSQFLREQDLSIASEWFVGGI